MQEPLVGVRSEISSLGAQTGLLLLLQASPISLFWNMTNKAFVSGFQSHEADVLEQEHEPETENSSSLHELRLTLLQHFLDRYSTDHQYDGVHVIPFMQVILMLTSDLDSEEEKDRVCLEALLNTLVKALEIKEPDTKDIWQRTTKREVHLVIMRLLSKL